MKKQVLVRSLILLSALLVLTSCKKDESSATGADANADPVLLLEAPGNRVRSFYAVAGAFHFVTNCERLATRFLECARIDPAVNVVWCLQA